MKRCASAVGAIGAASGCGYVDPHQVQADLCTSGARAVPCAALECWGAVPELWRELRSLLAQVAVWAQRPLRAVVFDPSWAWLALACLLAGAVQRRMRRRMYRAICAASTTGSAISR